SDERGQSVVETALSLPIMTVMLLGSFEGVRILLAAIALTSGVLAGAEYGALGPTSATDTTGIASAVRQETTPVGGSATNPTVTSSTGTDPSGETYVSVSATYTWSSLVPYPGLPRSITLRRSAVMLVRH
ncbi:MAG: pilus assembly protein, partial [Chloroflexota bacterium]|nr:pilus assembly protein [Chloroflexota bacterium]